MKVKNLKGKEIERDKPKRGEIWRHFKGNEYKIVTVGKLGWTGNIMSHTLGLFDDYKFCLNTVVYYERDKVVYDKPLDDFMDVTPIHKYPDAKQEWRFEKVEKDD